MIKFDYEKIMQIDTVVHCDTYEKAINLLKWADSIGLKWCDSDSYLNNAWGTYKEETCYYFYKGMYYYRNYYNMYGYKIHKYEDVIVKK